ncbi:MAG: hypothetical protein U9Q74_13045 [Gemmatimonadota bacterium]|nr:hypothetical protein [Gemmatimonadota bacterium]
MRPVIALLAAALAVGLTAATASAHDKGTLKIASHTFAAGDSLSVTGVKFSPRDEVTLVLIGASGRHPLADVPTDSTGGFKRGVLVPATLAAGRYRLIAEALDGDEVASLDVVVTPPMMVSVGVTTAMDHPMPGMDHAATDMSAPTNAPVALTLARSTPVTTAAVILILACFATGAALLRPARSPQAESHS